MNGMIKRMVIAGAAVTMCAAAVCAGTPRTWDSSASSDWFNAANWDPAGVPAAGDEVTIGAGTAHYFATPRPEVVAAVNVDSIAPDPCKTGALALRLKRSPYSLPFAGDYLFDALLQTALPESLPVRAQRPDFADDTIVSGPGIRVPAVYLSSSPGKRHHHSDDLSVVNWEVAHAVTRALAAYVFALARVDAGAVLARLTPLRLKEEIAAMIRRLDEALDPGASAPRAAAAAFVRRYAAEKVASLARFGGPPLPGRRDLLAWVRNEAALLERLPSRRPAAPQSAAERLAANLIPGPMPVYPFCLRRIPRDRRGAIPADADAALNLADGKRDLAAILAGVGCERLLFGQPVLSEGEKRGMVRFVERLARYGYLAVTHRDVVTRAVIVRGLRRLGIRRGDAIVAHVSLSSLGYVEGGARAVCEALQEAVGEAGTLTLPSFNHGAPFAPGGAGRYDPLRTPTTDGAVAECFRHLTGVRRSLDPTHPFCVWGAHAAGDVRDHHRVLTMGRGSPLERLERRGGKVVLIGAGHANTFHHVVETTRGAPCLGRRTEAYPVRLPSGRQVVCRTWGWREGCCPVTDKGVYWKILRDRGLVRVTTVGPAEALCVTMRDCRRVIARYLDGKVTGCGGCRTCGVRPRRVAQTVASDWDDRRQRVAVETDAFTGEWTGETDTGRSER